MNIGKIKLLTLAGLFWSILICWMYFGNCADKPVIVQALYPAQLTATGAVINTSVSAHSRCHTIVQKGLCFGDIANPMLQDSFSDAGPFEGNFTTEITGLLPEHTYQLRPYAIDEDGRIQYGTYVSFRTRQAGILDAGMTGTAFRDVEGNCMMVDNFKVWTYNHTSVESNHSSSDYSLLNDPIDGIMDFIDELDLDRLFSRSLPVPAGSNYTEPRDSVSAIKLYKIKDSGS